MTDEQFKEIYGEEAERVAPLTGEVHGQETPS
jgi:hypothetical protein